MIRVPGGTLAMGSTLEDVGRCVEEWVDRLIDESYRSSFRSWIMKEYPRHNIAVRPFAAYEHPVTNGEFGDWVRATGLPPPESIAVGLPDDHPVWGPSLDEAVAFARWRSELDGASWRLPTEAEWEWMAAGPEGRRYPFGDAFDSACCNTHERGLGTTTAVHAHPHGASWCGAMDLAGNVEEWTSTRYEPYPGGEVIEDELTKLVGPHYPIVRGGSFLLGGDLTRSSRRHGPHPGHRFRAIGFRLVHDDPEGRT